MRLYIVRHGKALADSESGRDFDRELAERGLAQAGWLAEQLVSGRGVASVRPRVIFSSEAKRAAATAEIIARAFELEVQFEEALGLNGSLRDGERLVARLLGQHKGVVLVGHNPQLSELSVGFGGPHLRTGELVAVEVDESLPVRGRLVGSLRLDE